MAEKREWKSYRTDIPAIEFILDYKFKNTDLLKEAVESYQRLEYLGDAVLEFVVGIIVYRTYHTLDRGTLTRLVRNNVENAFLGRVAINLGFHNFLLNEDIKNRAIDSQFNKDVKPPKVLANLIEAIAGAVYVDNEFSFDRVWQVFGPRINLSLSLETKHKKMEGCQNTWNEQSTEASSSSKYPSPSEIASIKETLLPEVSSSIENPFQSAIVGIKETPLTGVSSSTKNLSLRETVGIKETLSPEVSSFTIHPSPSETVGLEETLSLEVSSSTKHPSSSGTVGVKETLLPEASSSPKYPSPNETVGVEETLLDSIHSSDSSKIEEVSAECNCNEVRKFIENLMPSNILDEMEEKLNYNFNKRNLFKVSFCQSSDIRNLMSKKRCKTCEEAIESAGLKSCESMEFLGHLFLKLAIVKYWYNSHPGKLSKLRSETMNNTKLAKVATEKLEVRKHLRFSNKSLEIKVDKFIEDVRNNCKDLNPPSALCNIVECIAGAIFLDSISTDVSLENSSSRVEKVWEKFKVLLEPLVTPETLEKHPVAVQELCQKEGKRVEYKDRKLKVSKEQMISVEVLINDEIVGAGENIKKEVAKKMAARSALEYLKRKKEEKLLKSRRLKIAYGTTSLVVLVLCTSIFFLFKVRMRPQT